jgi:FkbM family methyltransferase
MFIVRALKRFRESYYGSLVISSVAKPVHACCDQVRLQIERKVRKNGIAIRLPNGQVMRIAKDAGIWLCSSLLWHGLDGYERETSQTLQFFFDRAATLVDVGANYGFYTILAGLWNRNLRVVAFEPVPLIYEHLRRNVAINGLERRVLCESFALANFSGDAKFYLPQGEGKDCEATGTMAADSWQVRHGSPHFQVQAIRFDDYDSLHPIKVDLVKIDVEDSEADVLTGMQRTIRRDRPFIVCEILPRNKEHKNERTRQIVESLRYTAYWITPGGWIRVSRFDFERGGCKDFLLSPVSAGEEVVTDLDLLWKLRRTSEHLAEPTAAGISSGENFGGGGA